MIHATALLLVLPMFAVSTPVDSAAAGGPVWCTQDRGGNGALLYQRTKDCCAAAGGARTYFDERYWVCTGYFGISLGFK
jgi:Family of unknown function (DUF5948)